MILWTIQPIEFWHKLEKDGQIYTEDKYIESLDLQNCSKEIAEIFSKAQMYVYGWLAKEMKKRIGSIKGIKYPLWAWYQWYGEERKRPDLRSGMYSEPGTKMVRIELELPDNQVVLHDYDLWHFPLNNFYLYENDEDDARIDKWRKEHNIKLTGYQSSNKEYQQILEQSWLKVFDLEWCKRSIQNEQYGTYERGQCIQATFWILKLANVKNVKKFTVRGKAR